MKTTRRIFLGGLAAASVPTVAAATPVENTSDRVERLGYELADAMNGYGGGKFRAVVYPSERAELPVTFQKIETKETQEEKCIRLTKELLAEFSKLPPTEVSRAGPYIDLRNDADIDCLRYVRDDTGRYSYAVGRFRLLEVAGRLGPEGARQETGSAGLVNT